MSNRVEELERKASELQAAVNGLTEELVETKERVRQLEDAVEVDDPAVRAKPHADPDPEAAADAADSEAAAETDSEAAAEADAQSAAEADDPDPESESEQRFVDADEHEKTLEDTIGPEGNSGGEEAKTEEEKEEETESEQDGSDIIVA